MAEDMNPEAHALDKVVGQLCLMVDTRHLPWRANSYSRMSASRGGGDVRQSARVVDSADDMARLMIVTSLRRRTKVGEGICH